MFVVIILLNTWQVFKICHICLYMVEGALQKLPEVWGIQMQLLGTGAMAGCSHRQGLRSSSQGGQLCLLLLCCHQFAFGGFQDCFQYKIRGNTCKISCVLAAALLSWSGLAAAALSFSVGSWDSAFCAAHHSPAWLAEQSVWQAEAWLERGVINVKSWRDA